MLDHSKETTDLKNQQNITQKTTEITQRQHTTLVFLCSMCTGAISIRFGQSILGKAHCIPTSKQIQRDLSITRGAYRVKNTFAQSWYDSWLLQTSRPINALPSPTASCFLTASSLLLPKHFPHRSVHITEMRKTDLSVFPSTLANSPVYPLIF